jgi:hypothetical protein
MLSGCAIPWPHFEQQIPEVKGVVSKGEDAVSGARVYLLERLGHEECSKSKLFAVTDENGRFSIKGDKDLRLWLVMGDPIESWGVCIEYEDQLIVALRTGGIGVPPPSIELNCDLSSEPRITRYGKGICDGVET